MAESEKPTTWWLFFFIPVTLVLSSVFLYKALTHPQPELQAAPLKADFYLVETARGQELTTKPMVGNCFLCHAYWVPIPRTNQTSSPRFAHADIQLNHGSNDRCYNCHQISDRNNYVADDGSDIMVQLPEQLCARCHGLIYNDWLLGTHGKWTGKWDPVKKTEQQTYSCTQCHDPHSPKFKYEVLAPPPVWPDKYIRTKLEHTTSGPTGQFQIDEEPREIF